ncbi:hypothetical protein Mp_5g19060 [Marchantia polymorpha subsp. ruderalis]|uniref:Uncharacterized protein n=2 Tax=Marchantia polymorpha TaxID=3197 RepID=A0AAF6BJY0_MARPO|nr:hypothetical protein MARPO_0073s0037 [Marchantia polymorpha]BBN12314.1 hypothetical protein Mp_5g19060 [Marchantia polymorpha subsp. ruderalis]|eukprot:PTQ35163.1 hypothetical protein MARPO_0073s0037 [Marchantia polymorpha]
MRVYFQLACPGPGLPTDFASIDFLKRVELNITRLCKIIIVPKTHSNFIKNVKLVMEIVCGQKFVLTRSKGWTGNSRIVIVVVSLE